MESVLFLWDFPFIHEDLKELNCYNKILIQEKNSIYNQAVYDEVFLVDDITNISETENIIKKLINDNYKIKAIYGTIEPTVEVAGELREKFNIAGIKRELAIKVRNKFIMKQEVQRLGIKTANCIILKEYKDFEEFIDSNGLPIIIKPIDGAGTLNTYKIGDIEILKSIVDFYKNSKINIYTGKYILESFNKGEEYHCDSIVYRGKVIFSSIGKYFSNLIETVNTDIAVGSVIIPQSVVKKDNILTNIVKINEDIINGFGIDNSICHLECFVDGQDIKFGEIATRIGGGPLIGSCIQNTHGVSLYKAFVNLEINNDISINSEMSDKYSGFITFPTYEGYVKKISKTIDFNNIDGLVNIKIFSKEGDLIGTKNSTFQRTGYAIVEDKDYKSLNEKLMYIYNNFILEVSEKL